MRLPILVWFNKWRLCLLYRVLVYLYICDAKEGENIMPTQIIYYTVAFADNNRQTGNYFLVFDSKGIVIEIMPFVKENKSMVEEGLIAKYGASFAFIRYWPTPKIWQPSVEELVEGAIRQYNVDNPFRKVPTLLENKGHRRFVVIDRIDTTVVKTIFEGVQWTNGAVSVMLNGGTYTYPTWDEFYILRVRDIIWRSEVVWIDSESKSKEIADKLTAAFKQFETARQSFSGVIDQMKKGQ